MNILSFASRKVPGFCFTVALCRCCVFLFLGKSFTQASPGTLLLLCDVEFRLNYSPWTERMLLTLVRNALELAETVKARIWQVKGTGIVSRYLQAFFSNEPAVLGVPLIMMSRTLSLPKSNKSLISSISMNGAHSCQDNQVTASIALNRATSALIATGVRKKTPTLKDSPKHAVNNAIKMFSQRHQPRPRPPRAEMRNHLD